MIQYVIECIAFQLLFLIIYDLFLKRETFFQWNRAYLIGTYILSMILPWIKIEALKTEVTEVFQAYPAYLWNTNDAALMTVGLEETTSNLPWMYMVFFGGVLLATLLFAFKLLQIHKLRQAGEVRYFEDFTRIVISDSSLAFSFFKSIFLGDQVLKKKHQNILDHELVHIRQKHSYDLMFFELMRIVGWFNPLVYVYQSRVSELHEFIADAKVAKTNKKEQYELLLSQVFQTQNFSFINQFFKSSLIKKRIVMLQKTKSKKVWQLKYLLLVPLVLVMLSYTSAGLQETASLSQDTSSEDAVIIEEIQAEIKKEVVEYEKLARVQMAFTNQTNKGEEYIFTKREYFKNMILHREITKNMKVEFGDDVKPRKPSPLLPLPSTISYENYVNREKAFQVLDKNLMISINQRKLSIRTVVKEDKNLGPGEFMKVSDVSDLTGDEILKVNNKIGQIDFSKSFLFLSDYENAFLITRVERDNFSKNSGETIAETLSKQEPEVIKVTDVQNLTAEEEKVIFNRLEVVSALSKNWEIIASDNESYIKFYPSSGGSYITSPDGKAIQARQILNYKPSGKELNSWSNFIQSKGNAVKKHRLLIAERERLLQNMNEEDPIIIALDEQLSGIRKSINGDGETIPFAKVDEVPIFPGCEDADDTRACFQQKMQRHISKNFKYPLEAQEKGFQGRVSLIFTMNTEGGLSNLKVRGPHKLLEDEAVRIISRLPKIQPGKHKGEVVKVSYSIPITFKLQTDEKENPIEKLKSESANSDVPFGIVDQVPVFPGCENEGNKRACFNKMMQEHISKNFNYPKEAQEKGIQGRVNIMFTISKDGLIKNLRMRGPDPLLEAEAKRIIMRIPDMKPGRHEGKNVDVPFSIPISFRLQSDDGTPEKMILPLKDPYPLVIIDGKESTREEMEKMHQDDIASINILKDKSATAKYGVKGKNGVVIIKSKKKD